MEDCDNQTSIELEKCSARSKSIGLLKQCLDDLDDSMSGVWEEIRNLYGKIEILEKRIEALEKEGTIIPNELNDSTQEIKLESEYEEEESFYAFVSEKDDILELNPVDDSYKEFAIFKVKTKGQNAVLNINEEAISSLMPNAEVQLLPFVDYTIDRTGGEISVIQKMEGLAVKTEGRWIIIQKVKLLIN